MTNVTQSLALGRFSNMDRWIRGASIRSALIFTYVFVPASLFADSQPVSPSEPFVEAILGAEAREDHAARAEYLAKALQRNPKDAVLRGQSGHIWLDRKWIDVDQIQPSKRQRELWEVYVDQRLRAPDSVQGQLALANWCRRHRLRMQERSHLQRVIEFDPDHQDARQRLGFVQRGTRWAEVQSLWENEQEVSQMYRAAKFWSPKVQEIAKGLGSSHPRKFDTARASLDKIEEPDVVYAVEMILGYERVELARVAIEKISEFPHREASMALARIAITSPNSISRELAAQELRSRRKGDFVPALLNELSKPIESRFVAIEANGQVQYRHTFSREHRDQTELDVRDLALRPENVTVQGERGSNALRMTAGRSSNEVDPQSRLRAISSVTTTMMDREQEKETRNAQIAELNSRITTVLALATDQPSNDDPAYWWSWWDQENDVYQSGPKLERTYYVSSSETYQTTPSLLSSSSNSPSARYECFVAGTPVLTWQGPVAIEHIRRGDIVVSQHPATGELALQPVLATTTRPMDDVLRLTMTHEEVNSSPGHPFWVSGEGWKLAKELGAGDIVHGLRGGYRVTSVEPGTRQVTYNLLVDRFHTYFVGDTHLLVHDNTEVRATNAKLPGY